MSQLLRLLNHFKEQEKPLLLHGDMDLFSRNEIDFLQNGNVLVPIARLTHVACDACHEKHVEEIVTLKNKQGDFRFRIPCPINGWVEVPKDQISQWTINFSNFAQSLANAACENSKLEVLAEHHSWKLGEISLGKEVYCLVVARSGGLSPKAICDQIANFSNPLRTILISIDFQAPVDSSFAATIPITEAFRIEEDGIQLQKASLTASLHNGRKKDSNEFRLIGEYMRIIYKEKEIQLKKTAGLFYIHYLIESSPKKISSPDLLIARSKMDPSAIKGENLELLDHEAIVEFRKHRRSLEEDMENASRNCDNGHLSQLQDKLDKFDLHFKTQLSLGGRSRSKSPISKISNSVSTAISRDLEKIEEKHPLLGAHLTCSINTGLFCDYSPVESIEWVTWS